ncbi:low-density lipoprotein receptor-related [Holotrichia oblita]|uniref:Low-density lipoprotein receptor-related n=1 Tax=Holotrichia oblita TaxID=644536 RepID=A0ACB9TGK5_HOLOL|nr:low-density lipoprotein receptor-related [Holotrichia oblita]
MDDILLDQEIEEPDEDDLNMLDMLEYGTPRQVNQRMNYFERMDGPTFRKRFRLSKECVQDLLIRIEEGLEYPLDM